ncbi:hypothetical protein, partial [Mesorhizobium japonicum]|uniref:hypothetical protein n=1 Tax=Mesorhizobium japonicum TaxID=2066070 RepID=UPI003B5C61BE
AMQDGMGIRRHGFSWKLSLSLYTGTHISVTTHKIVRSCWQPGADLSSAATWLYKGVQAYWRIEMKTGMTGATGQLGLAVIEGLLG